MDFSRKVDQLILPDLTFFKEKAASRKPGLPSLAYGGRRYQKYERTVNLT